MEPGGPSAANGDITTTPRMSTGTLLRKLTSKFVPSENLDRTLKSVSVLMESSIGTAPSLQSVDSLMQALLLRLVRDGDHTKASQLANCIARLKIDPAITQDSLWSVLYLMSSLQGTGNGPNSNASSAASGTTSRIGAGNGSHRRTPAPASAFAEGTVPRRTRRTAAVARETPTAVELKEDFTVDSVTHSVHYEAYLIPDLLLVIQGNDGKHMSFVGEPSKEVLEFSPQILPKLSAPMKAVARAISELGFLFRLIRYRCEEVQNGSHGFVRSNFADAVIRELDGYYKSIVALRAGNLTLRQLYKWGEQEKEKLRIMARLCDELRPLRGGQVLAHLRKYRSSYFAPGIQEVLSRLFSRSVASLNRMLESWLTMGTIDDPHGEFFVMVDPKVKAAADAKSALDAGSLVDLTFGGPNAASGASNRIWWGLYKVRSSMLPAPGHKKLADTALSAGKSVAFLRKCCSDSAWIEAVHSPEVMKNMPATTDDKNMLGFEGLNNLVECADASASRRLMELFYDKFNLSHHFAAIKRYLLLSQGDFTQSLIDSLSAVLDGDGELMLNRVTGIVDAALRSTSIFNEATDMDILERLNVKIVLEEGDRRIGWDVFSLTYRVEDAPLNTVFSKKVMEAYLSIFRFLWKLKRMDHLVNKIHVNFSQFKAFEDDETEKGFNSEIEMIEIAMTKANFLRGRMTALVQNVEYYCTFEVLEVNWNILEHNMAQAKSLSELIEAHANYLADIKDRTLLSERGRIVLNALNDTLDTIPPFYDECNKLCDRLRDHNNNSNRNLVRDSVRPEKANQRTILEAIEEIESEFDKSMQQFLYILGNHAVQDDKCLFLLFRLDFNGYYAAQKEVQKRRNEQATNDNNATEDNGKGGHQCPGEG